MFVFTHHPPWLIPVQYSPESPSPPQQPMGIGCDCEGKLIEGISPPNYQALQP
ncbi:hypothetical protein CFP56_033255 [Quercus suber]|uniref:Uncharacterized protein n=1 Tax=Quercus suber TaxID=58331 RepID=A0AAW0MBK8_QUESU